MSIDETNEGKKSYNTKVQHVCLGVNEEKCSLCSILYCLFLLRGLVQIVKSDVNRAPSHFDIDMTMRMTGADIKKTDSPNGR